MIPTLILIAVLIVAMLVLFPKLVTSYIPQPLDESLRLESSANKTANFNGTAFDQTAGFQPGGVGMPMAAVLNVTAIDFGNADETYSFVLEESDDNVTFVATGPAVAFTATGYKSVPGFVSKRYVRCRLAVGGTTPSITYEAWLSPNVV